MKTIVAGLFFGGCAVAVLNFHWLATIIGLAAGISGFGLWVKADLKKQGLDFKRLKQLEKEEKN